MTIYEYILIIGTVFATSALFGFIVAQCIQKVDDEDEAQAEDDARLKVAMNAPIKKTVRKVRAGTTVGVEE